MKRIILLMKDYKKESILAPLFKMLEAIFELFVPLLVASIIDQGIGKGNKPYIAIMCLFMLILALIGLVCSITAQYYAAKAAVGTATELRAQLFGHIQSLGFTEMDQLGTSTMITRMTSDINQVQNGINLVLRLFLRSPFIVFGSMIMAFTIDIKAALIFAVIIPLLSLVVYGVMFLTKPMYRKVQYSLDRVLQITRENLVGVRVIRAFHREENEHKNFQNANNELTALQKQVGRISGLTNPITFVMINIAIIVLVQAGAIRVNTGTLTQGQVVALYNYMSQILVELIKLANLIVSVTKALACSNRINDLLKIKPVMQLGAESEVDCASPWSLEFHQVSFAYAGAGGEALTDISFRIKKGQTVGVIGGTGAGKTTMIQLIPRFYDVLHGDIFLFGRNVKNYTEEALRRLVAVVPQKAQLFQGTIRENLVLSNPEAKEQQIEEALQISQAKEFVDKKEGRLNAKVEQGGRNLSGGQKQRLTIARALVMKPEILILDDSASALDYATDANLRKAIRQMEHSPTVIIVTQRASSILHADQILVLDDGKLAGVGRHEELLENCSVYQEIYYSQFKREA